MIEDSDNQRQQEIALQIIEQSFDKDIIYKFMKAHNIGESEYGKILDESGRIKKLFYHRLEGHHPIFDLPFNDPDHIPDFIEHVWISDSATKQGLPIIPHRFLEHSIVKSYIQKKTIEWNFLNVFDLMVGTLAVYAGYKNCQRYFAELDSIDSFEKLAIELGIGLKELALSVYRHNPLLFIGAIFQLIGTAKGLLNSSDEVYFKQTTSKYYMIISDPTEDLEKIVLADYLQIVDSEDELTEIVKSDYL